MQVQVQVQVQVWVRVQSPQEPEQVQVQTQVPPPANPRWPQSSLCSMYFVHRRHKRRAWRSAGQEVVRVAFGSLCVGVLYGADHPVRRAHRLQGACPDEGPQHCGAAATCGREIHHGPTRYRRQWRRRLPTADLTTRGGHPTNCVIFLTAAKRASSGRATDSPMKKAPFGALAQVRLAEPEGFEPSMQVLPAYSLSRGAPSASRSQLRRRTGSHSNREEVPLRRPASAPGRTPCAARAPRAPCTSRRSRRWS